MEEKNGYSIFQEIISSLYSGYLQKYTDEEHRLSQKEILEILRKEYEMIVDRKTVRRNLLNLMEYDCEIECREVLKEKTDRSVFLLNLGRM